MLGGRSLGLVDRRVYIPSGNEILSVQKTLMAVILMISEVVFIAKWVRKICIEEEESDLGLSCRLYSHFDI